MKPMIEIFEYEQKAGLADLITESFAKGTVLDEAPILQKTEASEVFIPPSIGEVSEDTALVYAVLVSVDWNKNDDVFTDDECWAAKETSVLKPANKDHQKSENDKENKIIGVIKEAYAVDNKYNIITDGPEKTEHIVCGISLWERYWPSAVADIKENIDDGSQFVSMECLFKNFGYALRAADGSGPIKLLPRNKETAKLTSYLRSFKGKGVVTIQGQEYRIGRWLRNVVFTGVGFVQKPANPNSIVFTNYVSHASEESVPSCKFETISEINLEKIEENSDNSVLEDSQIVKEESMADVKEAPKTEETKETKVETPVIDEALAVKVSESEKRCADLQAMCDKVQKEYNEARAAFQKQVAEMDQKYKEAAEALQKKETAMRMLQATIDTMQRTAMANDRFAALAAIEMTSVLNETDEAKAKEKVANFTESEWKTILTMAQQFVAKASVKKDEVKTEVVAQEVAEVKVEKNDEAQAAEVVAKETAQASAPSVRDQFKAAIQRQFGKNK